MATVRSPCAHAPINPVIIEGQIHGGLTEGFAVAMGQQAPFDARATCWATR